MTFLRMLVEPPLFQALGWSLLHFIWQGSLVAILFLGARSFLRECGARVRYRLACMAMLLMLMLPLSTAWFISTSWQTVVVHGTAASPRSRLEFDLRPHGIETPTQTSESSAAPPWQERVHKRIDPLLPWLSTSWLTGVLLLSFKRCGGWIYARRLTERDTRPVAGTWQDMLLQLCRLVRVTRPVVLLESALVQVPTVIGWLRPVILLPTSTLLGLTADQLEAILAHELAHIRRNDYLVNLLQTVVETLLFYHPAVWWVSHQIRLEREHCCDELVVTVCGDPLIYAWALTKLEEVRSEAFQLALAANGGSLVKRVQRILGISQQKSHGSTSWIVGLISITAVFILAVGLLASHSLLTPQSPKGRDKRESSVSPGQNVLAEYTGQWLIDYKPGTDVVHLSVRYRTGRGYSDNSYSVPLDQVEGLLPTGLMANGSVVKFQVKRDAGSFDCEGWIKDGQGSGHFKFSPSPGFAAELRKRGYDSPSVEQQFSMAMYDVSLALVDELSAQGYQRPSLDQLVKIGTHGVRLDYVKGLKALGYQLGSVDRLIEMRDHGVDLDFIKGLGAFGYKQLAAEELVRSRDHGVDPEFIKGLKATGYDELPIAKVVNLRDHGVDPEFVGALKQLGYSSLTVEDLIRTRDHGVTPDFVKELAALDYKSLPLDELIRARDHGVDAEFIRGLKSLGYNSVAMDQLIRMRDHGVDPAFVEGLRAAGLQSPEADQLIRLRDHGVTADFIKKMKAGGHKDLSVDQLINLRIHGSSL
jgi:beta-lactamase regulating signal transducer with metallopeptidase domain